MCPFIKRTYLAFGVHYDCGFDFDTHLLMLKLGGLEKIVCVCPFAKSKWDLSCFLNFVVIGFLVWLFVLFVYYPN